MSEKDVTGFLNRKRGNSRIDTKEFELPETVLITDIDTKVFQGIVLECLSHIEGVLLSEGNFIDAIFGRSGPEVGAGVHSEQNNKNHSVSIKIDIDIAYGISIPEKAEEIQSKVVEEITRLTGLRVSSVHVLFKNIIRADSEEKMIEPFPDYDKRSKELEYNDRF